MSAFASLPTLTVEALNDRVCQTLRDAIVAGSLAPGQRLVEERLAERLGVSRAPIREALATLQREGLVSSLPSRGVIVTVLTRRDVREIYGLRTALECWAVREACRIGTSEQLETLTQLVAHMERSSVQVDKDFLINDDVEFHRQIFELSGNQRLIEVFATIRSQMRLLSHQVVSTLYSDLRRIPERHQAIVDAIRSRNADAAEECVRVHVMSVAERIISAFPDEATDSLRLRDGHARFPNTSVNALQPNSDSVGRTLGS